MENHTFYLIYENTPMKLLNNFLKNTLFLITVLSTPDVGLMLQFKLPSDIEFKKINLKEFPVNNLKVSFMNKENISAECQFEDRCEFSFNPQKKMYTVSLGFVMTHMILSFCSSNENKNYVILEFLYNNKLLRLDSEFMESKKLYYVDKFNFVLDAFNEDEFKLRINIDDLRIQNAKHILSKFEIGLYEKICKNVKLFDHSFFEDHAKFDTLHFFNHILCFEKLKSFLSSLKSLQIINKDSQKLENLTGSYLSTFFLEKYDEEFKEFSDDNLKTRKAFVVFCNTHADKLVKDVFLLPIVSKYDDGHHLKIAYKIISTYLNSIKNITPRIDYNLLSLFNYEKVVRSLKIYFADEWLKYICCDANKPLNFHEYHSNIYGMNIKRMYNPEELEKIVCDYYNTIVCISNFLNREVANSHSDLKYVEPHKNYKLECSIFKGIQFNIVNKVHKIGAYNQLSTEILLEENLNYYKFDYTSFQTFVFPFEVMKKYKICEIELVFSDENKKKIKISNDLSI